MTFDLETYFDYAASTPVDPAVIRVMEDTLKTQFFNPSAQYQSDNPTKQLIRNAQQQVASTINAPTESIIWTSGATESNNLAILGCAHFYQTFKKHIITSTIEHSSIKSTIRQLENSGFDVSYIPVDNQGIIDIDKLKDVIRHDTLLVSVIAVQNEIGTIQPLKKIADIAHSKGAYFHVDAAQAIGKIPVDVEADSIDLMSLSAHKCYGPKGIGALYQRQHPKVMLQPTLYGGQQQLNIRPGTLPTHQILGMAKAYQLTRENHDKNVMKKLSTQLITGIKNIDHPITIYGDSKHRAHEILSFRCHGITQNALLEQMKPLIISTKSSCISHQNHKAHAVYAITQDEIAVQESIRIGIGRFTTTAGIERFIKYLDQAITLLK